MDKMSDEEKMEMMTKMMCSEDGVSCSEMMEKISEVNLNDTLSMSEKGYIMMPLCLVNILNTVEENEIAQYFTNITKRVIESGFNDLSAQDKVIFKQSVIKSIEELN